MGNDVRNIVVGLLAISFLLPLAFTNAFQSIEDVRTFNETSDTFLIDTSDQWNAGTLSGAEVFGTGSDAFVFVPVNPFVDNEIINSSTGVFRIWAGQTAFNESLYLVAGANGNEVVQEDAYRSDDGGQTWTQITQDIGLGGVMKFTNLVTFNDRMLLIGGEINRDAQFVQTNEIWESTDGISWTNTANATWEGRAVHTIIEFNESLYLLGGANNTQTFNDVWKSDDGFVWTQVTAAAPWSARANIQAASLNGSMYIFGETTSFIALATNDAWVSDDGENWTQLNNTPFDGIAPQITATENFIYIVGCTAPCSDNLANDIYRTTDGENWTLLASDAFPDRVQTESGQQFLSSPRTRLSAFGSSFVEDGAVDRVAATNVTELGTTVHTKSYSSDPQDGRGNLINLSTVATNLTIGNSLNFTLETSDDSFDTIKGTQQGQITSEGTTVENITLDDAEQVRITYDIANSDGDQLRLDSSELQAEVAVETTPEDVQTSYGLFGTVMLIGMIAIVLLFLLAMKVKRR